MSAIPSPWARPLAACSRADLPIAGGKAAQLGALAVVGVAGAMTALREGQLVQVGGQSGTIHLLP